MASNPGLPTGTVTFLFTDIEGSTALLHQTGDAFAGLIEQHGALIGDAITSHNGVLVSTEGDSHFAVFAAASDAVAAAAQGQRSLQTHTWPGGHRVKVRMGLHTGLGTLGGSNYLGLDVHRAARIAAAAHGGQVVLSEATAVLTERSLPTDTSLRDLGKHRLKDLSSPETILQLDIEDLPREFPPLRTLDAVPNNLPLQVTSFVGRDRLLEEAHRLLDRTRLLTLLGPGGTGKTRLSLQLAGMVSEEFEDGVFFVGLSTVTDPSLVASEILEALGGRASGDQTPAERLVEVVKGKRVLLVLDNFEQILEAAGVVAAMIKASPEMKVVVTSRAPLRLSGEQEMPIPPLQVATGVDPQVTLDQLAAMEAVELFLERAAAVRPDFVLTDENAADIVELVGRLDGLPLAIELAASRLRLLPVRSILQRFNARSLAGGPTDLPERQQSIWGAIDWSYDLLDQPGRELFARLSAFRGGARLEEIEVLSGDSIDDLLSTLEELVDHSLVRQVAGTSGPRYRMLYVIAEYAAEQLERRGTAEKLRESHARAYLGMVELAAPELLKRDRKMWLDLLAEDHDNLRAALDWAETNEEPDVAMRLAFYCWRLWQARGHLHEARERIERILAMRGGELASRAKALEALGGVSWWQGALTLSLSAYRQALEIRRQLDDPSELANALYNLSLAAGFGENDADQAIKILAEAESLYRSLEDESGLGDVAWGRGNVTGYLRKDRTQGLPHLKEAAEHYRRAGNEFGRGWALFEIGDISYQVGDFETAGQHLREGLELFANHGDVSAVVLFLSSFAGMAKAMGNEERAVQLAGGFHRLRAMSGTDLVTQEVNQVTGLELETLEGLTGELGEAFRRGQKMDLEEAISFALSS
ncbi:MAG: adenylate/guanylate cyclase domain-containing protein [Acidimicrobiia bacterium]